MDSVQPDHGPGHVRTGQELTKHVGKQVKVHVGNQFITAQSFQVLAVDQHDEVVVIREITGDRDTLELPYPNLGLKAGKEGWWYNWIEVSL